MEDYPKTLMEFEKQFSDESACRAYIMHMKWPQGFQCPRCGHQQAWPVRGMLFQCTACDHQASVIKGTLFQGSHLPLTLWFRAMWWVTSQKNGTSALGLQRVLGLGSYKTAWAMLHKFRRAMVRTGRERLAGRIEVDETFVGGVEEEKRGRKIASKALVVIAAQEEGPGVGRIRMQRITDASAHTLQAFVKANIEPGSIVHSDGWEGYTGLHNCGYRHEVSKLNQATGSAIKLLPRVHRVVSLLKRWLLGTHQGAVSKDQLDYYLDEFTFRFNRRTSRYRGKLFYRLMQQAVTTAPVSFEQIARKV